MAAQFRQAYSRSYICFIGGDTGSGKSSRSPGALFEAFPETSHCGAALVLQKKTAASTLVYSAGLKRMAYVWNGDMWIWPKTTPFVMLVTPLCLIHRLVRAESWADIAWVLLDEFHNRDPLALLLLAVIVQLKEQRDPRVEQMRLALVSATRAGPIVAAAEQFLSRKGVTLPSVTVPHLAEPPFKPHLWSVVPVPLGWSEMRDVYDRAVLAAKLMSEWIMDNWGESAVILFLPPGDQEVRRLATQLQTSPTLSDVSWRWSVMALTGDTTIKDRDWLFEKMDSQNRGKDEPCLFVVMKSGTGEDSWNPNCNGLIDMNEQMVKDAWDFLQSQPADKACVKQRAGRIGRHRRGVFFNN